MRALAAILIFTLGVAGADEEATPRERARELFKTGEAAYQAGHYDQAIHDYNEAFALVPMPLLLFDLGQAYRMKGERDKAIEHYRKYLDVDPQGRGGGEAREHLAELQHEKEAEAAAKREAAARQAAAKEAAAREAAAKEAAAREAAAEDAAAARDAAAKETAARGAAVRTTPASVPSHPKRPKWLWPVVGTAIGVVVVGVTVGVVAGTVRSDPSVSWGAIHGN